MCMRERGWGGAPADDHAEETWPAATGPPEEPPDGVQSFWQATRSTGGHVFASWGDARERLSEAVAFQPSYPGSHGIRGNLENLEQLPHRFIRERVTFMPADPWEVLTDPKIRKARDVCGETAGQHEVYARSRAQLRPGDAATAMDMLEWAMDPARAGFPLVLIHISEPTTPY